MGSPLAVGDDASIQSEEIEFLRLYHDPIASAEASNPLVITACVSGDHEGAILLLGYRPAGSVLYETIVMEPGEFDCYQASIPAEALVREGVEYYVKGEAGPGRPPAYVGHPNDPFWVDIVGEAAVISATGRPAEAARSAERPVEASRTDAGRPGSYAWRVVVFVVVGLAVLAYAVLRPKLGGLRR